MHVSPRAPPEIGTHWVSVFGVQSLHFVRPTTQPLAEQVIPLTKSPESLQLRRNLPVGSHFGAVPAASGTQSWHLPSLLLQNTGQAGSAFHWASDPQSWGTFPEHDRSPTLQLPHSPAWQDTFKFVQFCFSFHWPSAPHSNTLSL
ncbi:MAG: hypothetical protein KA712_02495 [Myxococcales bacterium]|nr:hypothetical protein [Myxococcales bacterium]